MIDGWLDGNSGRSFGGAVMTAAVVAVRLIFLAIL
jgi:hypothetical protein